MPMLFFAMILVAAVLTAGRLEGWKLKDFLVIRNPGETPEESPDTADPDGEQPPENEEGDRSPVHQKDRRTSFSLLAETNNLPAVQLPSLGGNHKRPGTDLPVGLASRVPETYDYTAPVPENTPADKTYLQDAVLIGDSRMQGLILYCGLSGVTSYTYKGLTVESVFTKPVIPWEEGEEIPEAERVPPELWENGNIPVMEALYRTEYNKVYIMLGINETGWPEPAYFPVAYGKLVDAVRADNPECLIYILSVFPVTRTASAWHPYATNEKISLYNEYLQAMAAEKKVFLIDLAPAVVDEEGVLPEDSGADGIHLNRDYCMRVLEHIYSHTVVLEDPSAPKDENTPEEETAPTGE